MSDDTTDTEGTAAELTARLVAWLTEERGTTVDEGGAITVEGDPPLAFDLTVEEERIVLSHRRTEHGAGAGRADAIIATVPERGTSLDVTAAVDREGVQATVTNHVYVDGVSRQSFIAAFHELVAAVDAIEGGSATTADATETKVQQPVVATVEQSAEPTPAAGPLAATHRVPAGGMRAWDEPDPSQQPSSRLEPGVELALVEQRGDWARVTGVNGWEGWVDARRLVPAVDALDASGGVTIGGIEVRPLLFVGAAALIISAFLPWVRFGSANSLDVPLSFLWDFTSSGDPQLGWFVIGLGVIALGLAVTRQRLTGLVVVVGVLAVAIGGAFVVQMYRGVADLGGAGSDLFDWLGFAPWVTLGAGVILVASAASAGGASTS